MRHRVTIHILLLVGVVFIDGGHGRFGLVWMRPRILALEENLSRMKV